MINHKLFGVFPVWKQSFIIDWTNYVDLIIIKGIPSVFLIHVDNMVCVINSKSENKKEQTDFRSSRNETLSITTDKTNILTIIEIDGNIR